MTGVVLTEIIRIVPPADPWPTRWRVYADSNILRVFVFSMYRSTRPTLEDCQAWFQLNHGEAVDMSDIK